MAVDVDNDTREAILLHWQEDPVLSGLFTQLPQTGRLKTGQGETYCQLTVKPSPAGHVMMTGGVRIDKRMATFKVFGPKADVTTALGAIADAYNRNTDLYLPTVEKNAIELSPRGYGVAEQDEATKSGRDVWTGTYEVEIWSSRRD